MSQQQEAPTVTLKTSRDRVPFPVAPRKKVAVLIAIIVSDLLTLIFAALSYHVSFRHEGYGRRGVWARPWNGNGAAAVGTIHSAISILTFGCHGLSEWHPRHVCYTRKGLCMGGVLAFFFNFSSLPRMAYFAWHFFKVRDEDDIDAYWVGVWTVCITIASVAALLATFTYAILCCNAVGREEADTLIVDERSEGSPLLRSVAIPTPT